MRAGDKAFDEKMIQSSGVYSAHEDLRFISMIMSILEPERDHGSDYRESIKAVDERMSGMIACPSGNLLVWDSKEE